MKIVDGKKLNTTKGEPHKVPKKNKIVLKANSENTQISNVFYLPSI